jgi:hypothetical protein
MICPYCTEHVSDVALVCKHCHRDLYVVRSLMEKLDEAISRLETMETGARGVQVPSVVTRTHPATKLFHGMSPVSAISLSFIFLVVAHFIIIIEYNLPLIYLRAVSIAVPLTIGFMCEQPRRRSVAAGLLYGAIVAITSIVAMSAVVGKIDNIPVLPRGAFEWREFAEYSVSITFGFLTGALLRLLALTIYAATATQDRITVAISRIAAKALGAKIKGVELRMVITMVRATAAVASVAISLTTGLRQFF